MKKILVVDDEKAIVDLLKRKLEQSDYAVFTATTEEEALAITQQEGLDLVLLDIAMPMVNGYTICEKLKGDIATKKIPVIFLSGKDFNPKSLLGRCEEHEAAGFFSKMNSLDELVEEVKKIIG